MTSDDILYAKAKNIIKSVPCTQDGVMTRDNLRNMLICGFRIRNSDFYAIVKELTRRQLIEPVRHGYKKKV